MKLQDSKDPLKFNHSKRIVKMVKTHLRWNQEKKERLAK